MAAALGEEIFSRGFRFNPTPLEAATYYIPRLAAGAPLHDAVRSVVHRADVYARELGDLARQFPPMPKTGDRFFFTSCGKKGARAAGPGSWYLQSTKAVNDGAAKVGEVKKFRYKKSGVFTDWLMDEFSSTLCSEDAGAGGDRQFVFCKIYVSPRAALDSAARHESAAFSTAQLAPPPPPAVAVTQVAALKRPAPHSAEPHCLKRMRVAAAPTPPVVQPAGYCTRTAFFAPPLPCMPRIAASAPPPPPAVPTRLAAPPPSRPPLPAPPQILVQPTKQQIPPLTLPVVRVCHVPAAQAPAPHCRPQAPSEEERVVTPDPKCLTGDPFEAVRQRYESEEERVTAPDPNESPAVLEEDDNLDELKKAMEDDLPTGEGSIMTGDEMGQHIGFLLEDQDIEFNYD
ncbi:unnamed protein product [Urochloa humidicola]